MTDKKFHHIAIAVKDLEDKVPFFCDVYNAKTLGDIYYDKNQLVKVQFIQSEDIKIELLEPMNSKSPISNFIDYHMRKSLNWSLAAAMGGVLLVIILFLYWIYDRVVGIDNMKLG